MPIIIANNFLTAKINPKGAELVSLQSIAKKEEYIWEGNPRYWGKHSPVLFPIVGTLKNNCYSYNNTTYQLSRHGFARDLEFDVVEQTNTSVVFSLRASAATQVFYPFDFELQISYTLQDYKITIEFKVINQDSSTIPFSIGAHPAFALPNSFDDYSLEFDKDENLNCFTLENDLLSSHSYPIKLTSKKLPLSYSLFENDAMIFKSLASKKITIFESNTPRLKVTFDDFNSLGLWTKVGAPFVCIEPWLGYSDTTNSLGTITDKEAIQEVKRNETFVCHYTIELL